MKQFKDEIIVNGRGMALADLVSKTILMTDKGLANMTKQTTTPMFPMSGVVRSAKGLKNANNKVPKNTAEIPCT